MDGRTRPNSPFEVEGIKAIRSSDLSAAVKRRHRHQGRFRRGKIQGHCWFRGPCGRPRLAGQGNNYYVVRANALEDNVVLYKTVNGVRSALDIVGRKGGYGVGVSVPANQWLGLRVDFKGSRFRAFYNGKQLFDVEDSTFSEGGKVGLWTKADSVTVFDQIIYGERN